MTHDEIRSYLYFGAVYDDAHGRGTELVRAIDTATWAQLANEASTEEVVATGAAQLRAATTAELERVGEAQHVVLLSGGYDSRAMLAALREQVHGTRVLALTYGVPGSRDFDLPPTLATRVGVEHRAFDTTTVEWDLDHVVEDTARRFDAPIPEPDGHHVIGRALELVPADAVRWHGWLGGVASGGQLPPRPSPSWDVAVEHFLRRNRQAPTVELGEGWDPRSVLPATAPVPREHVGYDDQVEIAGRQTHRIGSLAVRTGTTATPLGRDPWLGFMLAQPWARRSPGQDLYRRILDAAFPHLMQVPLQGRILSPPGAGRLRRLGARAARATTRRVRQRVPWADDRLRRRNTQKLDFRGQLDGHTPYRRFVETALTRLAARDVVDRDVVAGVWREHHAGQVDHTHALRLLAGLEVNLAASAMRG